MSAVDSLPGDQRAVLQLVLGRGRSYQEIARMLSIDPGGVRERALAALDALGPQTRIDQPSRAQICDYLLGQLPEGDVEAVRNRLAESAGERAWARVVSSELAPLASEPLPDIPLEASAGRTPAPSSSSPSAMLESAASVEAARAAEQPPPTEPDRPATPEPPTSTAAGQPVAAAAEAEPERTSLRGRLRRDSKPPKESKPPRQPKPPSDSSSGPRSSRLGGLIVIGVVVAIVVVALIVLLGSGSSKKKPNTLASTPTTAGATPAASATTPAASASSSATTTTTASTAAKVVAQINLTPPATGSKAAGIAEVLHEGTTNGIAIVAQNVPPNTTHPPNAYAVWLYNSPTDAKILGFVNPGVPTSGKLSTAGGLPTNASHYKELIVTVESSANPKAPGTVILQGTLTGV
jgi:Sigma-70, region 4